MTIIACHACRQLPPKFVVGCDHLVGEVIDLTNAVEAYNVMKGAKHDCSWCRVVRKVAKMTFGYPVVLKVEERAMFAHDEESSSAEN